MTALLSLLVGCQDYALQCREPEHDDPIPCDGVCINEIGADNGTFVTDTGDRNHLDPLEATEDWVELYNNGPKRVVLDHLVLERDDSGYAESRLPPLALGPGTCVLLVASAEPVDHGPRHLALDLNSDWGTLRLWTDERCLVDRVYYPLQDEVRSWGRAPGDGGERWDYRVPDPCNEPEQYGAGHTGGADTGGAP